MSEEMKATVSEDPELFDVAPEEETANETEGKLSVWETIVKGLCKFASWFGFGSKYYRSNKRRKKLFFDVITYVILIAFAFIMIYPFWWMISASFAKNRNIMINESTWWPSDTRDDLFGNYANVITIAAQGGTNFWQSVGVTLLYSLVPVTVGIITSTMAAFAFAKLNFKGKNVVFFYCLAGIMIPGPSIMITQYCFYNELGWTLNGLAMIIPGCFGAVLTAFFIRQYLYGMPTAIIEAAKIDGAGYWRIFWQFVVPLAMPAITAQFILSFIGSWNNYLGPLLFVQSEAWYPLALLVAQFESKIGSATDNYPSIMAISVLALLPVLILFGIFQKWILGSIMLTGSKE